MISGMGVENMSLKEFKRYLSSKVTIGRDIFEDPIHEDVLTVKATLVTLFNQQLKLQWHNRKKIKPESLLSLETIDTMDVNYDDKYNFKIRKNIDN